MIFTKSATNRLCRKDTVGIAPLAIKSCPVCVLGLAMKKRPLGASGQCLCCQAASPRLWSQGHHLPYCSNLHTSNVSSVLILCSYTHNGTISETFSFYAQDETASGVTTIVYIASLEPDLYGHGGRVVQPIGSTPDQNARSDGMGGWAGGRAGGRN